MTTSNPEPPDTKLKLFRQVVVTGVIGGIAYVITHLTPQPEIWAITLSVFISGVVLVVQFLADFENRLSDVQTRNFEHTQRIEGMLDRRLLEINEAIDVTSPPLVQALAQAEVSRVSGFLKRLSEGEVAYDGEDRDWLLALARNARKTIDATSLAAVDAGGDDFAGGGLWDTDLGQKYLEAQRSAISDRQVVIRRLFILVGRPEIVADANFRRMCALQQDIGVRIRVLEPSAIPKLRKSSLSDFIIFDGAISYETTPALMIDGTRPTIANTRLVVRVHAVEERSRQFEELWRAAGDDFE